MLRATLTLLVVSAVAACNVQTQQGDSFNLPSSATNNGLGWSHQELFFGDPFTFHMNLCGPPRNDTLENGAMLPTGKEFHKCPTFTGSIFQVDEALTRCDGATGSWNTATINTLNPDKKEGLEIIYSHAPADGLSMCSSSVQSKWIVECTKNEEPAVFTELSVSFSSRHCVYNVRSGSPSVCKTAKPGSGDDPTDPKEGGLSGGWVFIIILVCLVVVYCGAGMAYNVKQKGMPVNESMPNREFWFGLPSLVKDGCVFFGQQCKALVRKCQGKSSAQSYDDF